MANFLLIHGGFMGGWVWKPTREVLCAAGHTVLAPSLDGCGERAHQAHAGVTITTQPQEMAQLLFQEDIDDAVVVSTSSGGMVAAKTAALARDRIGHLVFVDALAPQPGETTADIVIASKSMVYETTEATRAPSRDDMETRMFAELPPDLRAWAMARYTPHPINAGGAPGELGRFWAQKWPTTIINCIRSVNPSEAHQRRTAERLNGTYLELDAGHFPMLTHLEELSALLMNI